VSLGRGVALGGTVDTPRGVIVGKWGSGVRVSNSVGVGNGVKVLVGVFVGMGVPGVGVNVGVIVGVFVGVLVEVLVGLGRRVTEGFGVSAVSGPPSTFSKLGSSVARGVGVGNRCLPSLSSGPKSHAASRTRQARTSNHRDV
jgi:hypothetical protein